MTALCNKVVISVRGCQRCGLSPNLRLQIQRGDAENIAVLRPVLILANDSQRPFWPGQLLKDHIKPVAREAGLPNIGWHSFRRTVSAWGKEAGLELEDVKTLLRHENIATTSNVYGDIGLVAKRRIQERLVEFVKQQAETYARSAMRSGSTLPSLFSNLT